MYMLVGLQGAGKTTTAVKLAKRLQAKGKKPLVVSLDTHRPAAREQLAIVAEAAELPATVPRGRNPLPWPGRLWTSLPNRIMTCYSWIPLAACIWMMR